MQKQSTVKEAKIVTGVNVYNGEKNHIIFRPAEPGSGLVFKHGDDMIRASLENARAQRHSIWLKDRNTKVGLVEHVLSVPYMLGIDNLEMELSDGIGPTLDCGVEGFYRALEGNIKFQDAKKSFWTVRKGVIFGEDKFRNRDDFISVSQTNGFSIHYDFSYPHRSLGHQTFTFKGNIEGIINARPPAFIHNKKIFNFLSQFYNHGITEKNYLLVASPSDEGYCNSPGLGDRYLGSEPVRHKVIDFLGTLALTGKNFKNSRFYVHRTGHEFDILSLRKLFERGNIVSYNNHY